MQAEPSQPQRAALAPGGIVSVAQAQSTSPYLAAAPAGLFAPPPQPPLYDLANQNQHQQHFITADGSFQHPGARNFQQLVQDPSSSSHEAAFRMPNVPRTAPGIEYINPYQQLDPNVQAQHQHQQHFHPNAYASTSYSALTGSGPVASFAPDFASHAYAHTDMGMMPPNMGMPMMRYNSFPMSADDMSRAGSSNGTPGPMTQQDIDNLLAMSRAQAGTQSDASAFPCTYCDKIYTGKHARSIWRRHLQDKHNIPLSAQPRRTRWDGDVNRPKNAEERRARMLESKRRWARKKRLQEKQAAMGARSGGSNTPNPDGSDDDDDDEGADGDVSNMSVSLSRSMDGDDSLSMPDAAAHRSTSVKTEEDAQWNAFPGGNFFISHVESGRPAKRQALAPSTAHNIPGPSSAPLQSSYSNSPAPRTGLTLAPVAQQAASGPNDSFSSNSSEYSQPGSASFFNDSFGGNVSNSGSDGANTSSTSIDTPATTWNALPALDRAADKAAQAAAATGEPAKKGDTRDAAIQLLVLKSGSNSPSDERDTSLRRRDANEDGPWSSTPSRPKKAAQSDHAALTALSTSAEKSAAMVNDVGLSPSPISRALAGGAVRAMPVTTPGPANNPFSLDKHKISPYEGRRKLSYSGAPASPIASPTHLNFALTNATAMGGVSMGKSLSSASSTSTGVKLPPLVSTPIRPSSQGVEGSELAGERIKLDSLPPLLGSASKKSSHQQLGAAAVGPPLMMATPFSKPLHSSNTLGYSALRRAAPAPGTAHPHASFAAHSVRPSPSRHHSNDDQFSSPQHLNLTESLGLAPHSISRTSSYASGIYASSLGLTPSVANISGGMMGGTPFHSGLGALSGLSGFTPFSAAKIGGGMAMTSGGGLGAFWPESVRKSGTKASMLGANSPTVYKSSQASASSAKEGSSGKRKLVGAASKAGSASPALAKGDIFDADYRKHKGAAGGPSSDDTFDDDDDEENLMSIGALDTPSRPAALRKLPRTNSRGSHKLGAGPRGSVSPGKKGTAMVTSEQRSPLSAIKLN